MQIAGKIQGECRKNRQNANKMKEECTQIAGKIQEKCKQGVIKLQAKCSQNEGKNAGKINAKMQAK